MIKNFKQLVAAIPEINSEESRDYVCGEIDREKITWKRKDEGAMDRQVYGYVNGKAVYSREEFVFTARGFGPITDDAALLAYAEKVTHGWHNAGWKRTFTTFFLNTYEVSREFTKAEFARLQELQRKARAKEKVADAARRWEKVGTYAYADNSIEEVWEDKDGNRKTVMTVHPHGDAC